MTNIIDSILADIEAPKGPENITSTYDVIGAIPNVEEILKIDNLGDINFVSVIFDEQQNPEKSSVFSDGQRADSERAALMLKLMLPAMKLVDTELRKSNGLTRTAISAEVEDRVVTTEEDDSIDGPLQPHTDPIDDTFLGVIGAPTILWPGEFSVPPIEQDSARRQALAEQIETNKLTPFRAESGEIVRLNSNSVHQSPESDPAIAGQRRILFFMNGISPLLA